MLTESAQHSLNPVAIHGISCLTFHVKLYAVIYNVKFVGPLNSSWLHPCPNKKKHPAFQ